MTGGVVGGRNKLGGSVGRYTRGDSQAISDRQGEARCRGRCRGWVAIVLTLHVGVALVFFSTLR